ncbi:MAG: hypothetical protein AAF503_03250 [Pseudomonadota bacterium]
MGRTIISIASAGKHHGPVRVCDDVGPDCRDGASPTLLDPPGSGEATPLTSLAGFADLDRGQSVMLANMIWRHLQDRIHRTIAAVATRLIFPTLIVVVIEMTRRQRA